MKKFLSNCGFLISGFVLSFLVFCLDCFFNKDLSCSDLMSLLNQPRDDLSCSLGVLCCYWLFLFIAFFYDIPWKRIFKKFFKKKPVEENTDSPT